MRELAFFVGSLAGAIIMSALAVLIRPELPFWKVVLWGGIGVFTACTCVLVIDYIRPHGNSYLLAGMAVGIALIAGCGSVYSAVRFLIPHQPANLRDWLFQNSLLGRTTELNLSSVIALM